MITQFQKVLLVKKHKNIIILVTLTINKNTFIDVEQKYLRLILSINFLNLFCEKYI